MAFPEGRIRAWLEEKEEALSPYAARGRMSKGRERPEAPCPYRTPYQVDRDRVLASKAFRRLMRKTQVFIAPLGDHYMTRLTHTLEVTQLARAVTRALNLNEDLAEAVALSHDLGHTPFGHLGEQVLTELVTGGFRHNRQSVRVVEKLENKGQGLNLSWEVRQGILRHSKGREGIEGKANPAIDTLEAQTVKICDALSYVNHDLEDAYRAGILKPEDVPDRYVAALGRDRSQRFQTLLADLVQHSWAASGQAPVPDGEFPSMRMGPEVREAANGLRDFLFERVYLPLGKTPQAERARDILRRLFDYFVNRPQSIPEGYTTGDDPVQMAVDYISGMTDRYALLTAEQVWPGISAGMQTEVPTPV